MVFGGNMKKQDLLKYFDDALMEKLFGFCYARTKDSFEAEELCSDILYALVKAAQTDGEIQSVHAFIWRVARNVYADFSDKRRKKTETTWTGDAQELFLTLADEESTDDIKELLTNVYRRIAFLTKAYREVMISFYIDGLSTAQIAAQQGIGEGTVRQRLFSARQKIKSEVEEMAETYNKPVALDNINYVIWGTGSPAWGDPRDGFCRQFSNHILWLCHKKPMSAAEIAEELNVPWFNAAEIINDCLENLSSSVDAELHKEVADLQTLLENLVSACLFGCEPYFLIDSLNCKRNACEIVRMIFCKILLDILDAAADEAPLGKKTSREECAYP
mgnify:CR=1 FL=1